MQNQFQYQISPQMQQAYQQQMYYQNKKQNERNKLIKTGIIIGATLIFQLIVQTVLVVFLQKSDYYATYLSSSLFQNAFNIIAVDIFSLIIPFYIMSLILKRQYTGELIPRKKLDKKDCLAWIGFGMGGCVLANYFTAFIIALFKEFGYKLTQTEYIKPSSVIECTAIVFSTALAPALCEEFAMRCCTLGALRKYGKGFAVVAVSIVFGLIHGNVIQFVFAFLMGLIFGYITIVTDSVVPAMFIHGFTNGISVLNDIITYAAGSKAAEYVSPVCYIIWLALAVWGIIYLTWNKKLIPKREKKQREPYALSFGAKLLCLLPGLFIPICILLFLTSKTIVPIN